MEAGGLNVQADLGGNYEEGARGQGSPRPVIGGMGAGGHGLDVGGVMEEMEADKGDRGVLLWLVKSST